MKTTVLYMMLFLLIVSEDIIALSRNDGGTPSFGFNAGISQYQVKERNLNGLVHRGPGFNAGAVYSNFSRNVYQRIELMVGFGFLKTGFEEDMGSYQIQSSISYQYTRLMTSRMEKWKLYLGGVAGLDARQGIYENWDKNHYYWLTNYSLGFSAYTTYKFSSGNGISLEMSLPLLSIISRTPESLRFHEANPDFLYVLKQVHENPSLKTPNENFLVEFKVAYHLKLREKASQTLYWRMNYVNNHVSTSNQIKTINHSFGIEFLF